jgi:hypothetical protein
MARSCRGSENRLGYSLQCLQLARCKLSIWDRQYLKVFFDDGILTPHAGKLGTVSATVNVDKMAVTSVRLVAKRYILRGTRCGNMNDEPGSVRGKVLYLRE